MEADVLSVRNKLAKQFPDHSISVAFEAWYHPPRVDGTRDGEYQIWMADSGWARCCVERPTLDGAYQAIIAEIAAIEYERNKR